jgi:hypothetical protein
MVLALLNGLPLLVRLDQLVTALPESQQLF